MSSFSEEWDRKNLKSWKEEQKKKGAIFFKVDKKQKKEFEDRYGNIKEYFFRLSLDDLVKIAKNKDTYINYTDRDINDLKEDDRYVLAENIVGEYEHKALVLKKAVDKLIKEKSN